MIILPGMLFLPALATWHVRWILTGIARRPATRTARELLEDDTLARTRYVFRIPPLLFVGLNLFLSMLRAHGAADSGECL